MNSSLKIMINIAFSTDNDEHDFYSKYFLNQTFSRVSYFKNIFSCLEICLQADEFQINICGVVSIIQSVCAMLAIISAVYDM